MLSAHSSVRNQDAMPASAGRHISQPIARANMVALETLSALNPGAPVPSTRRTSSHVISRHIQSLLIRYWLQLQSPSVHHPLQPPITDTLGDDQGHCQDFTRTTRTTSRMTHQDQDQINNNHDGGCQLAPREVADLRRKLRRPGHTLVLGEVVSSGSRSIRS